MQFDIVRRLPAASLLRAIPQMTYVSQAPKCERASKVGEVLLEIVSRHLASWVCQNFESKPAALARAAAITYWQVERREDGPIVIFEPIQAARAFCHWITHDHSRFIDRYTDFEVVMRLLFPQWTDASEMISNQIIPGPGCLVMSAMFGSELAVKYFLAHGIEVQSFSAFNTALHLACKYGHDKVVEQLLDEGADIDAPDLYQRRPFQLACKYGHTTVVKLLLKRIGAETLEQSWRGSGKKTLSPLSLACKYRHLEIMKLLLQALKRPLEGSVQVERHEWPAETRRDWVASHRDININPLQLACERGFLDGFKLLVDPASYGGTVHARERDDIGGQWHIRMKMYKVTSFFTGSPLNAANLAVLRGHEHILQHFKNTYPEDLNTTLRAEYHLGRDQQKQYALHLACEYGRLGMMRWLQKELPDLLLLMLNEKTIAGDTPLHLAVNRHMKHGDGFEMVTFLLSHGADRSIRNDRGAAPLQGFEKMPLILLLCCWSLKTWLVQQQDRALKLDFPAFASAEKLLLWILQHPVTSTTLVVMLILAVQVNIPESHLSTAPARPRLEL